MRRRIATQDRILSILLAQGGSRTSGGFEGQPTGQNSPPETMLLSCRLAGAGRRR